MTDKREAAKQRSLLLKELRDKHKDSVEKTRLLLKEQKATRQQICQQLRDSPKIVPEIAKLTGLPAHTVLWHITAMKKYDLVVELEQCGEYYLYTLSKEFKA